MRAKWMAMCGLATVALLAVAQGPKEVKVKLTTSKGEDGGTVTFKSVKDGVRMKVDLKNVGFGPHGVHIHQNAVCDAPDFKGAGGHFNPDGKKHGFENPEGHHAGDTPMERGYGIRSGRGAIPLDRRNHILHRPVEPLKFEQSSM